MPLNTLAPIKPPRPRPEQVRQQAAERAAGIVSGQSAMPSDIQAEQALLGALLIQPERIPETLQTIAAKDFFRAGHEAIYEALVSLSSQEKDIDLTTVSTQMKTSGTFDQMGGIAYLTLLLDCVPVASHAHAYAARVAECAMMRRCIEDMLVGIGSLDSAIQRTPEAIVNSVKDALETTLENYKTAPDTWVQAGQAMAELYEDVSDMSEPDGARPRAIRTGLAAIDEMIGGLTPGRAYTIAARPGMGKTALAIEIGLSIALAQKQAVGIMSLEMTVKDIAKRMVCTMAGINTRDLDEGQLTAQEWQSFALALQTIENAPIYIDGTYDVNIAVLDAKVRRMVRERDLKVLFIDHIGLVKGTREGDKKVHEMGEITRVMRLWALSLDIVVVELCQLNRMVESRDNKRPMLADLRDSGEIEQNTTAVIFIYNAAYYAAKSPNSPPRHGLEEAELIIAKNNYGPTGIARIGFRPHYTRYENIPLQVPEDEF